MKINCPSCGDLLDVPDEQTNRMGRCLSCNAKFFIPNSTELETSRHLIDSNRRNEDNVRSSKESRQGTGDELLTTDSCGFLVKSLPALFFISLGLFIGLLFGYYIGKNIGINVTSPNNGIMKIDDSPIINLNGESDDPFGID